MSEDGRSRAEAAAARVIGLEQEVESSGYAALDDDVVAKGRAALHDWVDSVAGLVISPALGRVTLIHGDGRESVILSPRLALGMSAPAHRA